MVHGVAIVVISLTMSGIVVSLKARAWANVHQVGIKATNETRDRIDQNVGWMSLGLLLVWIVFGRKVQGLVQPWVLYTFKSVSDGG